jgi:hypothetical protein
MFDFFGPMNRMAVHNEKCHLLDLAYQTVG